VKGKVGKTKIVLFKEIECYYTLAYSFLGPHIMEWRMFVSLFSFPFSDGNIFVSWRY